MITNCFIRVVLYVFYHTRSGRHLTDNRVLQNRRRGCLAPGHRADSEPSKCKANPLSNIQDFFFSCSTKTISIQIWNLDKWSWIRNISDQQPLIRALQGTQSYGNDNEFGQVMWFWNINMWLVWGERWAGTGPGKHTSSKSLSKEPNHEAFLQSKTNHFARPECEMKGLQVSREGSFLRIPRRSFLLIFHPLCFSLALAGLWFKELSL